MKRHEFPGHVDGPVLQTCSSTECNYDIAAILIIPQRLGDKPLRISLVDVEAHHALHSHGIEDLRDWSSVTELGFIKSSVRVIWGKEEFNKTIQRILCVCCPFS